MRVIERDDLQADRGDGRVAVADQCVARLDVGRSHALEHALVGGGVEEAATARDRLPRARVELREPVGDGDAERRSRPQSAALLEREGDRVGETFHWR
jgi:hypothetical protein